MRILLTVHQFLPRHGFGTERLTYDTGRELLERGHEVHVLTTDNASPSLPHDSAWDYDYKGLKVRTIGLHPPATPDPLTYEFNNPRMAEHMRSYMRQVEPDLVHVMHAGRLSGSIIPAAKEFGVPVVFSATDFWSVCRVIHLKRADTGELCLGPDRAGTNCLRCYISRLNVPQAAKNKYLNRSDAQFRGLVAAARNPAVRSTGRLKRVRTVVDRIDFLKNAVNMTDRVIAPTELNRDLLIRNGIAPRLITYSHYGMDTSEIRTAPRSPTNPTTLRVGYIGSLARHKGVDTLIKSFKGLPEMQKPSQLKIYGTPTRDREYFTELENLVGNDNRISFEGTFEGEKLGWVLSEIDVLVVPSRWYENTPLVVYSAFASGTPVVATDVGGLSEAIDHEENGLLFEMDDARELNAHLLRFLMEPELLGRLREGMKPVKTARESVDEFEEIYGELTESSAKTR